MERLPSLDERKWLGRYLRKLIERRGVDHFVAAPMLAPTAEAFPDRWNAQLADVHRLTQRLMHAAGLSELRFSLAGTDAGVSSDQLWDPGTAGWFGGIDDGVCRFGVHPSQLRDPEQAIGVMAHEVAHAFRTHHRLTADNREREELLTDLTTIYLGFGIFTTNNTDRYRSSGNWSETRWSTSSAGYLPPQSMAWLLALQVALRDRRGERAQIAKHLEPNQAGFFKAALDEIASTPDYIDDLRLPPRDTWAAPFPVTTIAVEDPPSELLLALPPVTTANASDRNSGVAAYRMESMSVGWMVLFCGGFGAWIGWMGGLMAVYDRDLPNENWIVAAIAFAAFVLMAIVGVRLIRHRLCTACRAKVRDRDVACLACGATLGAKISEKAWYRIRTEELERHVDGEWEECDTCRPEEPCEQHRATVKVDREWFACRS